jgi:hypothetical protein
MYNQPMIETDCVPMKWPSGPLELARRERKGPVSPELRETLRAWHQPAALERLSGTAVDCLIVTWAAGLPQDEEQQGSLKPLIERGRQAGIQFIGWVDEGADTASAAAKARAAGLSAVVSNSDAENRSELQIIPISTRSQTRWDLAGRFLILNDAIWPQIRSNIEEGKDQVDAGPTGIPWVNSNGWYVRLAKALNPEKVIWLAVDPPKKDRSSRAESYLLAMADAWAYGAHWVISLDETLQAGLASGTAPAMEAWREVAATAAFFKRHDAWTGCHPQGVLAVLSDFSGANEFMSGEILNLLCRRHLPLQVIARSRATASSFEGLKAILYADQDSPTDGLRQDLLTFVQKGGLLIAPSNWKMTEGVPSPEDPQEGYQMRRSGSGRVALAKQEWQDPYEVATETHLMLSHSNDLIRLWNAGGTNSMYTASPDGSKSLVQIVNYSVGGQNDSISLWLKQPYRSARFWSLSANEPVSLQKVTEFGEAELHLPPFPVYGAVELEK